MPKYSALICKWVKQTVHKTVLIRVRWFKSNSGHYYNIANYRIKLITDDYR